jgi:hypothetical protein
MDSRPLLSTGGIIFMGIYLCSLILIGLLGRLKRKFPFRFLSSWKRDGILCIVPDALSHTVQRKHDSRICRKSLSGGIYGLTFCDVHDVCNWRVSTICSKTLQAL